MRWTTPLVAGLGGVLAIGVVPGATARVDPSSGDARATVSPAPSCTRSPAPHPVRRPQFVRTIPTGETGWFASPGLADLNGDGRLEIVAPFYSTFVFDAKGHRLARTTATPGRAYAPEVVTDLEGDGVPDIVVGGTGKVAAYTFRHGTLHLKQGWPASVRSGGQTPEVRGMAAADLNHDGKVEVVATTTNTSPTGAQVFVFNSHGRLFQPTNGHHPAWPRYNRLTGTGNDLHFNRVGNHGYGEYGENVGIGNIDDDPDLEVITTFDNHQINAFNDDGTSILASRWFTNRESDALGRRMGWGQFIRWASPRVERRHYHLHVGAWPSPARQAWLQWTDSPPNVADLDGDGRNEVIGLPDVERHIPYRTQGYAFMALDGAYGDGHRSARRHAGFETLPMSNHPRHRPAGDWYPPSGIPAPTMVDISGDSRPEIVSALPGGKVYAVSPGGHLLWSTTYAPRRSKTFASEVVAADLNKDGRPELVFGTYALHSRAGRLIVLSPTGHKLSVTRLRHQRPNGNGVGVAAAPSIGDLTGNGSLEIVLTTFDHGIDVYTVPGSGTDCLPWPTGRGNLLRNGMSSFTAP